jgi:hypothetical protein
VIPLKRHTEIVAEMNRELGGLREELTRASARCSAMKIRILALETRIEFLEKLMNEAPHAPSCVVKYRLRQSKCNCWKKGLSGS